MLEDENIIGTYELKDNKIYEVWYEFFDGTQANMNGYHKKIATYMCKEKAIAEKDRLNSKVKYENPYYIKEVILDD